MAEKLLKKAGHEIIVPSDGETGLEKVFENQADLILVDLGLPDMDGQTLVALMRQQPNLTSVPIIAFTAWPEDNAHDMATRYGCDGVIVKPINTRDFAKQIENFMRKTTKK
jgi:DNA-binding response OmpR family regulator